MSNYKCIRCDKAAEMVTEEHDGGSVEVAENGIFLEDSEGAFLCNSCRAANFGKTPEYTCVGCKGTRRNANGEPCRVCIPVVPVDPLAPFSQPMERMRQSLEQLWLDRPEARGTIRAFTDNLMSEAAQFYLAFVQKELQDDSGA